MELLMDRIPSPIGEIIVISDGENLRALDFHEYEHRMHELLRRHYGEVRFKRSKNPAGVSKLVQRYLDGDFDAVNEITVKTNGTPFQKEVWTKLRQIPSGKTISYGDLARRIGKPKAPRAVGLANGSNPIAIVVPCHRVIGANGSLTGYGGGIERKQWLLAHEDAHPA
ncbi:MAG: methylated-DNA--[protein]-cysteine S-methyltransferase [Gammaproteobacteria bacterium]